MAKKKTALEKLRLSELSLVNAGANQYATVSICKMRDEEPLFEEIAKYYYNGNGRSISFNEVLNEDKKWKNLVEAQEEFQPLFGALQSSITSNFSDTSLSDATRQANIETAINDFLNAVREIMPELEEDLQKMFEDLNKAGSSGVVNPDGEKMSAEIEKKLAEVEKTLAEKTAELEKAYKDMAEMKAMEEKKKKEMEMKKNDETVEVSGQKISKSAVGEETFAIFKAQAEAIAKAEARIAKAEEAAEIARLEKRASEEFPHLPGTPSEHALMLKAIGNMEESVAKSFEAVMKAADEKNATLFKNIGVSKSAEATSAEEKLEKAAEEIRKSAPTLTKEQALVKAYEMNPELVKELA